ncbi:MAG: cyclic nucleotide-binding domain-containing protein [Myxococcales bacterium]|nr:cyclic nucleotide-binding domain-containing protein [Myxococcales bacterium]MCB9643370.1 cyclic nucleotide-binding domain-containing protein [Myxococcales bacterium]
MDASLVDVATLQQIPIFSDISPRSLGLLSGFCRIEEAEEGELIFTEGQQGDRFFVVLSGAVRISRYIEGVGEELLSMCREGNYFGELSLVDDAPRSADARAAEPTRLLTLRKVDLEEVMFADADFAREMLWVLVRRLAVRVRETNEKLRALYQMELL